MKRITAKFISAFLAVVFVFCSVVYAGAPVLTIERTLENGVAVQKLVVKGNLSDFKDGERVTLKIYDKSLAGQVDFDDYVAFEEGYVSDNGSYEFKVEFDCDPSHYAVEVNSLKNVDKDEIYVPSLDRIITFINDLNTNNISNEEAASQIFTEYTELAFDVTVYNDLDADVRANVIADMKDEISTFDIENVYESFGRYTLINALNNASTAAEVKKAIDFYDEKYLGTSAMSVEALKTTFNRARLDSAYNHMKNKGLASVNDVKNIYMEGFILSAYKNVDAYLNLYDILNNYKNEIGISTQVSQLTPESTTGKVVLRYLTSIKNSVNSLEDLKNQVIYALANVNTIAGSDSTAPSGGGGGGGGGGGAGGGTHVSVDPNYGKNENQNSDGNFEIALSLTDVSEVPWAADAINALFSKGIVSGKGDGLFKPSDNVTRAEMTKMLVESMGVYNKDSVSEFSDAKSHWSNSYVASAYNKGYVYGVTDELFGVDRKITRQDAAVMIYRIIQISAKAEKISDVLKTFTDMDDASQYAVNSIKMLAEYGIINGFSDGSFKPKANLTRAEAAVIINNFLKYMEVGI